MLCLCSTKSYSNSRVQTKSHSNSRAQSHIVVVQMSVRRESGHISDDGRKRLEGQWPRGLGPLVSVSPSLSTVIIFLNLLYSETKQNKTKLP